MPQHVRVDFHVEARCAGRVLDHGLEAAFCTALADKYAGRFGSLLTL
jgi:hypothetical protein